MVANGEMVAFEDIRFVRWMTREEADHVEWDGR